jgi:hypothetical protein
MYLLLSPNIAMVDLRKKLPPVRDQGRRDTCVAFAVTAAHEAARSDGEDLSEEYLFWAAKQRDGLPQSARGTTLQAALTANDALGQPLESFWPYSDLRDHQDPSYRPPAAAHGDAKLRRVEVGGPLIPTSVAIRSALEGGSIPLLVLTIHKSWFAPNTDGTIDQPSPGSPAPGRHAVIVVGRVTVPAKGDHFIVRNSWSERWGDGGYAYIPYAYVDDYGEQAWILGPPRKDAT